MQTPLRDTSWVVTSNGIELSAVTFGPFNARSFALLTARKLEKWGEAARVCSFAEAKALDVGAVLRLAKRHPAGIDAE